MAHLAPRRPWGSVANFSSAHLTASTVMMTMSFASSSWAFNWLTGRVRIFFRLWAAMTTSRSVPLVTTKAEPVTERFANSWAMDLVLPSMVSVESRQTRRSCRAFSDRTQRRANRFIRLGSAAR